MQAEKNQIREDLSATYSPEDNKLRIYSAISKGKVDKETYNLLQKNGFKFAPKQELFVAPRWTPSRAQLLINLCGEIGDEETSLRERAKQREERFKSYQENRKVDAESAYNHVKEIQKHSEPGQPILIGHHSEKKARRDAKQIENGMRRTVKMWETSEYWEDRAEGVVEHANYKDRPDVRIRRIKNLEAEKRKFTRFIKKSEACIKLWTNPDKELTWERARDIANYYDHISGCFPLDKYQRGEDKSQYEGSMSLWSALEFITPEQAQELAVNCHNRTIKHYSKWLKHTELRLVYEKTILCSQGQKMPEKKKRPKLPLIVNFPMENAKHMTKSEYAKIYRERKGCHKSACGSYRYRIGCFPDRKEWHTPVFITDQKIVEPPKKENVIC